MTTDDRKRYLIDNIVDVLVEMTTYANQGIEEVMANPDPVTYGDWAERLIAVFEAAQKSTDDEEYAKSFSGWDAEEVARNPRAAAEAINNLRSRLLDEFHRPVSPEQGGEDEFAPGECTGAGDCDAPIHVHGCYRPHRADQCDTPDEYGHIEPQTEPAAQVTHRGTFGHVWPCPLFYVGNWKRIENGFEPVRDCTNASACASPEPQTEPTDAEVDAAARALLPEGLGPWEKAKPEWQEHARRRARAALRAARSVTEGENR